MNIGYYDPDRLRHADNSQDTDLLRHVPISTFCCNMLLLSQSADVTDGRTDVKLVEF